MTDSRPNLRYNDPPLVHRGPTSILAPNPGESYDLSSSHQQPIFVTQPLRNNSGVRSPIGLYPHSGLGSLDGLDSVQIYQTCELTESLTSVSSENRFSIRGPMNEPLFAALERSKDSDRLLWGASRPYSMQLLDKTHQESLILERRHDCSCICCCCRAERMFLIIPPGDVVGIIEEEFSLFTTELVMRNSNAEAIYRISIPKKNKFYMPKEKYFKVKDGDNLTEKGSIVRRWNSDLNLYTMIVYFTDPDLNIRLKSLYIGAAFLLEYMYFQTSCSCRC